MAEVTVAADWLTAQVDLADNSTTVYSGPCLLRGVSVVTDISAQACPIKDNTTTKFSLPASATVGQWLECGDARIETSLVVDPDDSATGDITVVYKPYYDGKAGSGH